MTRRTVLQIIAASVYMLIQVFPILIKKIMSVQREKKLNVFFEPEYGKLFNRIEKIKRKKITYDPKTNRLVIGKEEYITGKPGHRIKENQ